MEFKLTPNELNGLFDPKSIETLKLLGGAEGLATALNTNLETGLSTYDRNEAMAVEVSHTPHQSTEKLQLTSEQKPQSSLQPRIQMYGQNVLPPPETTSLLAMMWDAMHDKTLIVLTVAAVVEIAIGIYKMVATKDPLAIVDGCAIIAAILIVVLVSSVNDYRKQAQFRALNSYSQSLAKSRVVRDGLSQQIQNTEIVVGDVVIIETGDVLPTDGVLISGFGVKTDESSLTGESDAIKKDTENDPFLLSGTKVIDGMGKMLVVSVGTNSVNGRILMALQAESEETPLQVKLSKLADVIAKFGISAAGIMVVILLIAYLTVIPIGNRSSIDIGEEILNIFISAVTLIVVAVPEGLPMAVTLALAHATLRMLKDNNLVRHLAACETMGNATTICSDKTGTLTMNKMTVVKGWLFDYKFTSKDVQNPETDFIKTLKSQNIELLKSLALNLNINSTASESVNQQGKKCFMGSKTEVALLEFTQLLGFDYSKDRSETTIVHVVPFNSARKKMSTIVKMDENETIFSKGASEIILSSCSKYVSKTGAVSPIDASKRSHFERIIKEYASDALRTIGVCYKTKSEEDDLENLNGMILLGIFGIQDPVRVEVPEAVQKCQRAGVVVRMVTGDNLETAKSIARQCGILTSDGKVMEGPAFRALSEAARIDVVPNLQVLARSSPQDKQILVNTLKLLGETVAVTGDGTNDGPALTAADVGFSMGIAGTEVAKEASDIVLMDDNFASLVKAVIWGRSVYDSVRKFLQFQLTVNVSAVTITVLTSFLSVFLTAKKIPYSVLSAVQLLWVNLIMDTLAALALATDPPTPELLLRKPDKKSDPLISPYMRRQIIGQSIYQIVICIVIYLVGAKGFGVQVPSDVSKETGVDYYTGTMVFNTFVFCQLFNEINARSITQIKNVFKGILQNQIFIGIFIVTVVAQVIIVQFGTLIFHTAPNGLDAATWLICIAFGAVSLPIGFLIRLLPSIDEKEDESKIVMERMLSEVIQEVVVQPPRRNKELWDKAIRGVNTQLRVVNAFRDAKAQTAFEDGVKLGAEAVLKSLSFDSQTGRVTIDKDRVLDLWKRARDVKKQVGIVQAFRGGRPVGVPPIGRIQSSRSVRGMGEIDFNQQS